MNYCSWQQVLFSMQIPVSRLSAEDSPYGDNPRLKSLLIFQSYQTERCPVGRRHNQRSAVRAASHFIRSSGSRIVLIPEKNQIAGGNACDVEKPRNFIIC